MEDQYSFDINLDFLDSSTTNTQRNATTTEGYQQAQGQQQLVYDVESLANRIASVNDLVVQLKTSKDENAKLQKQMQDLSNSAMSIRCMYEREKTEKAKYALLSKELQEKCDRAESQLTNKTLHFEQLTSKIEQTTEKGPIAYNELALRYQRLAVQLEDDKLLNHKERPSLQQIQDYIETKKLTPLPSFRKKLPIQPKKQFHDYTMQCNLKAQTKSQGTQSEPVKTLKKEMCTQGTQYTWYTTTRGTNTPSPIKTAQKEVKTKGTQYISSTTTRGTCTSAFIKQQTVGTNFPEVVPVSIEDIFKEMIYNGIPISPLPDSPKVIEEEMVMSPEMKSVGTNTGLKNVRKPIDYVSLSIKHSDSRPPSRNTYDRVKNESPFMGMPTINPFVGMGMTPLPLNCTLADIWNMLGQTLFGSNPLYPMHANMPNDRMRMNADMARRRERQRSRDDRSNSSKDYFDDEVLSSQTDYLPATRSIATSPTSPRELESSEDYVASPNFFGEGYIHPLQSSSVFVPVVRTEASNQVKPNLPIEIPKIVLKQTGNETQSRKSLLVDEILKLFPEYSHSLQKRKKIRSLLKVTRKEKRRATSPISEGSGIERQVGRSFPFFKTKFLVSESFQKTDIQSDWAQEQFATSREESDDNASKQYSNSSEPNQKEALEQSFPEIKSSRPVSDEVFLGFDDENESVASSDEVFCKPPLPPKRRQSALVSSPYNQLDNSKEQRMHIDGEEFETTGIANHPQQNDLQLQTGRRTDKELDVTHNASNSLCKRTKRKRQMNTLDIKQSSKIHKVDESSSAPEPVMHSNSALNLNNNVIETNQSILQGKRASPTPHKSSNSTLDDEKTSNLNKSSTLTKYKQSNSIIRKQETTPGHQNIQEQKDMQSLFETNWNAHASQGMTSDTGRQITRYGDLLSSNENETDWDFNDRQGKQPDTGVRCKFSSPIVEKTNSDFNERQGKPLDTGEKCNFRSPTPEKTDCDSNERQNNPSITMFNIELSSPNQHDTDRDFNDRQSNSPNTSATCKILSLTVEETDSDFNERQGKPLNAGFNSKIRSPTPGESDWDFNERQNNPSTTEVNIELPSPNQHETGWCLNNRQENQPDTRARSKFPSLTVKETDSHINDKQGKPLDTAEETDCNFDDRQNTQDETDGNFKERRENYRQSICHNQKISTELQTAESETSFRSIFKSQETAPEQDNQMFIHYGLKTSKSNSILAQKPSELSDSNIEKHSDGVIEDQNPHECLAPRQDQPTNSAFYNQRTSNTVLPVQEENQWKFKSHETTTKRLSNTNNITSLSNQQILSFTNEYPSTISFSAPNSSGSELDLTIDCPKSPMTHDSSVLEPSSLLKTPELENISQPHIKAADNCNGSYHTSSTDNFEHYLLSQSAETDKPKFQMFLTKILDEVATPLSPISVIAPSEKAIDSEPESSCDEEGSQTSAEALTAWKWKRKPPATAAIAVKRSARLKAKNKTDPGSLTKLSLLNIPGIQLGKYTKKKIERRKPMNKLSEVEDVQEEKTNKKEDIIGDIKLGYFKDLMDEEMATDSCSQTHAIAGISEKTRDSKENILKNKSDDLNTCHKVSQKSDELCQTTPWEAMYQSSNVEFNSETLFLPKSEEVYQKQPGVNSYQTIPWQKSPPVHPEPKIFQQLESTDRTLFENPLHQRTLVSYKETPSIHEQTKIFEEKPKLIVENPSPNLFSDNECPTSPPPIDQKPEEMHVTREIVESTSVTTKPTSNSMISHIIANYNPKHHKMLTQARHIDKKLLAQLQSIINGSISGLSLVMDSVRTGDTLLNLTTSETLIAQALIGIAKTAPRPETEIPPPVPELYLSQTLRKLLALLESLCNRLPDLRRHLQAAIEQSLFTFTKDIMPLEVAMNLTQFYLAIIAFPTATSNPARLFICKCLYFYNQKATPMIYETLCVYPSVLPKREDLTYDRSDALINTIQCVLMSTFYDMEKTDLKSREMFTKLRKFYNYESFKPPRDEIIENLMAKIRAGRLKNVSYSFALICKRMEQRNSEKLVLEDRLLPLANEYYHTLNQTTDNDEKIACVLESISFIIKPFSVGTDISVYMNLFDRLLNACDRQTVQEAALAALLRTIRFGYVNCFNTIYNFKPNYELASSTKAMLKSFVYKKNLDFLKRLEHQAHLLMMT